VVEKSKGGRPPKPYAELEKRRKDQLKVAAREAIEKAVGGERVQEVIKDLAHQFNPRSDLEETLLRNIKDYFEETPPQIRGVSAAILTKDLPLKDASEVTGVSMGMISLARAQTSKGVFRVVKVFSFLFFSFLLFVFFFQMQKMLDKTERKITSTKRRKAFILPLSLSKRRKSSEDGS